MLYKQLEEIFPVGSVSRQIRVTNLRFSQFLVYMSGAQDITVDSSNLRLTVTVNNVGKAGKNIVIINNVPISDFINLTELLKGQGYFGQHLYGATVKYNKATALIQAGDFALSVSDMVIDISGTVSQDVRLKFYVVRVQDGLPYITYQRRSIGTDGALFPNVLRLFDVSSGPDSTNVTTLTFEDNSQVDIPHDAAFLLSISKNSDKDGNMPVPFGEIFKDKDNRFGRAVKFQPVEAFDAFIVQFNRFMLS